MPKSKLVSENDVGTVEANDVVTIEGEVISLEEAQARATLTGQSVLLKDGSEVPSPVPMAPPIGFTPAPSLMDQIRDMVKREMRLSDDEVLEETPEDEDDFDHPEAFEPFTRHEVAGMTREEVLEEAYNRGLARPGQAMPDAPGQHAVPPKMHIPPAKEGGEAGGSQKSPPAPPPETGKPEK